MKFDLKKQQLFANDGLLLKQLDCPLKKNWHALVVDKETPLKRYCNSCSKCVIDITEMDEDKVVDVLKIDAESCFCIRLDSAHIEFFGERSKKINPAKNICIVDSEERVDGCRIVKTARSPSQINTNKNGYLLIVKPVKIDARIVEKFKFTDDKQGYSGFDLRGGIPKMTNLWHPLKSTHPFAAYLVPKGVKVGERVFVPDIIEEFIKRRWNQGDVFRQNAGFGIFTGDAIKFNYTTDINKADRILG